MDSLLINTGVNSGEPLALIWYKILISILIGLLIGIERERNKRAGEKIFAGIRTMPMISLYGFLSALIADTVASYLFIILFLIFGTLVSISYYFSGSRGDYGGTTEMTFLIVFVLGALVYWDYLLMSAIIAVIMMIFLTFKTEFRSFAGKLEEEDLYATIKFAIITIIILPLLPDQTFGPFSVLNPRKIWYMVVLIAGLNFIGYVLFKLIGSKKGIRLLSILGGLASSTALTITFMQRSKEVESFSRNFASGIILASAIMFPRILLIVFIFNSRLAESLIIPVLVFTAAGIIISFIIWRDKDSSKLEEIELENPFKLMFAVKFGLLFAIVLFAAAAAQNYLGTGGIYITSFLSGLANLDAIALTLSDLVNGTSGLEVGVTGLIIAMLANTITKGVVAGAFGSKGLRKHSIGGFIIYIGIIVVYLGAVYYF